MGGVFVGVGNEKFLTKIRGSRVKDLVVEGVGVGRREEVYLDRD